MFSRISCISPPDAAPMERHMPIVPADLYGHYLNFDVPGLTRAPAIPYIDDVRNIPDWRSNVRVVNSSVEPYSGLLTEIPVSSNERVINNSSGTLNVHALNLNPGIQRRAPDIPNIDGVRNMPDWRSNVRVVNNPVDPYNGVIVDIPGSSNERVINNCYGTLNVHALNSNPGIQRRAPDIPNIDGVRNIPDWQSNVRVVNNPVDPYSGVIVDIPGSSNERVINNSCGALNVHALNLNPGIQRRTPDIPNINSVRKIPDWRSNVRVVNNPVDPYNGVIVDIPGSSNERVINNSCGALNVHALNLNPGIQRRAPDIPNIESVRTIPDLQSNVRVVNNTVEPYSGSLADVPGSSDESVIDTSSGTVNILPLNLITGTQRRSPYSVRTIPYLRRNVRVVNNPVEPYSGELADVPESSNERVIDNSSGFVNSLPLNLTPRIKRSWTVTSSVDSPDFPHHSHAESNLMIPGNSAKRVCCHVNSFRCAHVPPLLSNNNVNDTTSDGNNYDDLQLQGHDHFNRNQHFHHIHHHVSGVTEPVSVEYCSGPRNCMQYSSLPDGVHHEDLQENPGNELLNDDDDDDDDTESYDETDGDYENRNHNYVFLNYDNHSNGYIQEDVIDGGVDNEDMESNEDAGHGNHQVMESDDEDAGHGNDQALESDEEYSGQVLESDEEEASHGNGQLMSSHEEDAGDLIVHVMASGEENADYENGQVMESNEENIGHGNRQVRKSNKKDFIMNELERKIKEFEVILLHRDGLDELPDNLVNFGETGQSSQMEACGPSTSSHHEDDLIMGLPIKTCLRKMHSDCRRVKNIVISIKENRIELIDKVQELTERNTELSEELIRNKKKIKSLDGHLQETDNTKNSSAFRVQQQSKFMDLFKLMGGELTCTICHEIFIDPVTLNCQHTFCSFCMDSWKEKNLKCPECSLVLSTPLKSIPLSAFINSVMNSASEGMKAYRAEIIAERAG